MLLNLGDVGEVSDMRGKWGRIAAGFVGLALLAEVMVLARSRLPESLLVPDAYMSTQVRTLGAVGAVAQPLFTDYLLAFEVTSVLLLVAIIGAVILGKRRTAA
jgi:NADH-quinone oxidoreductase subunit J